MVSTLDSESSDPSSNLGGTYPIFSQSYWELAVWLLCWYVSLERIRPAMDQIVSGLCLDCGLVIKLCHKVGRDEREKRIEAGTGEIRTHDLLFTRQAL